MLPKSFRPCYASRVETFSRRDVLPQLVRARGNIEQDPMGEHPAGRVWVVDDKCEALGGVRRLVPRQGWRDIIRVAGEARRDRLIRLECRADQRYGRGAARRYAVALGHGLPPQSDIKPVRGRTHAAGIHEQREADRHLGARWRSTTSRFRTSLTIRSPRAIAG